MARATLADVASRDKPMAKKWVQKKKAKAMPKKADDAKPTEATAQKRAPIYRS